MTVAVPGRAAERRPFCFTWPQRQVPPSPRRRRPAMIGTLNEGRLHAQLKEWYRRPGDGVEQPLRSFVIDLVRGDTLIEIETGGVARVRRKLDVLLETHAVRVVVPIPLTRRIVRLSPEGEVLSARRSPRHGRAEDVFARLVSLPSLLAHDRFELELLLTHEEELRRHEPGQAWRRRGWVVVGRSLVSVERSVRLASPEDAVGLLPVVAEPFDTADVAEAAACTRRLAQQMTYCLRAMGALDVDGRRGRAVLYRRTMCYDISR